MDALKTKLAWLIQRASSKLDRFLRNVVWQRMQIAWVASSRKLPLQNPGMTNSHFWPINIVVNNNKNLFSPHGQQLHGTNRITVWKASKTKCTSIFRDTFLTHCINRMKKIISFSESVEIEMNTFQMNFRFSLHPELILKSQLYNWLPVMLVLFSTVPSKWKPLQLVLLIEMNVSFVLSCWVS